MADANMRIIISAIDNASAELGKVKSALKGMSGASDDASKNTESLTKQFNGIVSSIAKVTAALYAVKKVWDFSKEGASFLAIQETARSLATSMGSNFDYIISSIQEASLGTISYYDAVQSASNAMMLGLGADAGKLANLMQIAALRGRAMGLDTTQAFSDMVRGIGRLSPLILDNLGVVIDAENRYKIYAESIGKTAAQLTSAEKKQALLNGVLEEGNQMLAEAGGLTVTYQTGIERASTKAKNALNSLKITLGEVIGSLFLTEDERKDLFAKEEKQLLISSNNWEEYTRGVGDAAAALNLIGYFGNETIFTLGALTEAEYVSALRWQGMADSANGLKEAFIDTSISLTESQQVVSDSIKTYGTFSNMLEQAWANSTLLSQAIQGMPSYKKIIIEIEYRIRGMAAEAARLYGQYYDWYSGSGGTQSGTGVNPNSGNIPVTKPKALGGAVRTGEPYLVGEVGPELFVPQDNGTIIPNNRLNAGGKNVTIHITYSPTVSTASESEVQWILKPMIQKALKEM